MQLAIAPAEQVLRDHVDLALLERLYPPAAARAKTEPDFRDAARKAQAEHRRPDLKAVELADGQDEA